MTDTTRDMLGRSGLIPVDEARQVLLDCLGSHIPDQETVPLDQALDRVLAAPIFAPEDLPAHARSTMDGFAVRAADTFGASESMPGYLQIAGEISMGEAPDGRVTEGTCHRIPTGGLLPDGADAVVMLEHTVPVDDTMVEIVKGVGPGVNILGRGEDIAHGQLALPAGQLLRPQDLGLLAGLGIDAVTVTRTVSVGIISTGDEIVPFTETPAPGKIRDINKIALGGQVRRVGAAVVDYGIVSDRWEVFMPVLRQAVADNDLVLFSGGSSVGMRDLGEQAIAELHPPGILVHGVALKPGKPVIIGLSGMKPVFGLPGHPVSAMVCFDLFVRPAIDRLAGRVTDQLPEATIIARLDRNINSAAGRRDIVRVRLIREDHSWAAEPVLGKSGAISSLARAHGYFIIPESSQGISQDTLITVHLYS
ncbi:molybdopterin molybdotransferase MoeA [Desulfoprunum benzoelyticum]|uniref:Molybdopterin molybdenumtransferase n=1 Tax=Desulfoprunum benzoelyticum TaxID=1506996 RepID=A0A840V113_9BACT|nr:gephyrin-like molybdotransferase Glp [Desulfoprunum benzoelyticum]MBB5349364.1 molybdopterin molybdotransferase [Desulfoprunum benzoelyticum]MBM9531061.1 molybdopterin molybdotransferase MoeA [Desulfoprunum benzoelyticum]